MYTVLSNKGKRAHFGPHLPSSLLWWQHGVETLNGISPACFIGDIVSPKVVMAQMTFHIFYLCYPIWRLMVPCGYCTHLCRCWDRRTIFKIIIIYCKLNLFTCKWTWELVRGDHGKQCLEPSTSHPWLHIYLTINIRNLTKLSLGTISILLAFILAVIP